MKLHHLNLCTTNVPAMDGFYRDVLDMKIESTMARQRITDQGYPGDVSFVTDGTTQFHIAEKDLGIGFRTGQVVNPVEHGHIAFRTDDIAAFKKRLDEKGIAIRITAAGRWPAGTRFSSTTPTAMSSRASGAGGRRAMTRRQVLSFSSSFASASLPVALAFSRDSKNTSERWIGWRLPAQ